MRYARHFWDLFGVGYRDWDGLLYDDFLWMKAAADQHEAAARAQAQQLKGAG